MAVDKPILERAVKALLDVSRGGVRPFLTIYAWLQMGVWVSAGVAVPEFWAAGAAGMATWWFYDRYQLRRKSEAS